MSVTRRPTRTAVALTGGFVAVAVLPLLVVAVTIPAGVLGGTLSVIGTAVGSRRLLGVGVVTLLAGALLASTQGLPLLLSIVVAVGALLVNPTTGSALTTATPPILLGEHSAVAATRDVAVPTYEYHRAVPNWIGTLGLLLGIGVTEGIYARWGIRLTGMAALPLVALYAYTGLLLPWTQRSFALGQFGLDVLLGIPVFGEPLAVALFGGPTLSQATLRLAFRYHYAVVVLGLVCVAAAVGVAGWRRTALGRSQDRPRG